MLAAAGVEAVQALAGEVSDDGVGHGEALEVRGGEALKGTQAAGEGDLVGGLGGGDVAVDELGEPAGPLGDGEPGLDGLPRVTDEAAGERDEPGDVVAGVAGGLVGEPLAVIGGAHDAGVAAALAGHEGAEGEAADGLVPVVDVAVDVGVVEGLEVGAEAHVELGDPAAPALQIGFGLRAADGGVGDEREEIGDLEVAQREVEQAFDGFEHAAAGGEPAVDDVEGEVVALAEDGLDVGEVGLALVVGHHDRDLVEAQLGVSADAAPDLVGDNLDFAADARAGQQADAALVFDEVAAGGHGGALRVPGEDVALELGEQGGVVGGGVDEAGGEFAAGDLVEQADVFAAGAGPEAQGGGVAGLDEVEGVVAVLGVGEVDGLGAFAPVGGDHFERGDVEVFPELHAGVEGVDVELGGDAEPAEDVGEGRGDVAEAEDVELGGQVELAGIEGLQGVGEQHPAGAAAKEVELTFVDAGGRGLGDLGDALAVEEVVPEETLPALGAGVGRAAELGAAGPLADELAPGVAVFFEEPGDLLGELEPAALALEWAAGGLEVGAHGGELVAAEEVLVAEPGVDEEREGVGVEDAQVVVGVGDDLGEVVAQEAEGEVGGDTELLGELEPDELGDGLVGHDDRDRRERIGGLRVFDARGEGREEDFEAVGVGEMHGGLFA